jgi:Zn-dependent metalloprotease
MSTRNPFHCILPPDLLDKVARTGDDLRDAAMDTMQIDHMFRITRAEAAGRLGGRQTVAITFARIGGRKQRTIYDQRNGTGQTPGRVARSEGQRAVRDKAVNQAYDALGYTYDFFWQMFQRDSIDGQGLPMLGMVHFGRNYDNAFWDNVRHMFFGDGDGKILSQTTAGVDVVGHELTHGVTQHEANLTYSGMSGALNESISDVFGIMIKQWSRKQNVQTSDWLIGADIVGAALKPALRSMKEPGTANAHDSQPADMDHYIPGGDVHLNSGIPNRAFYVVATTLGGNSWDSAGKIWYATLNDNGLLPGATFQDFAKLTVANATRLYGATSAQVQAVKAGWDDVKVPWA